MIKKLTFLAQAIGLVACHNQTDPLPSEQEQKDACVVFENENFVKWDLRPMMKTEAEDSSHGADYHSTGLPTLIEYNFCRHLDETHYFASKLDMTRGVERLTGEDFQPDEHETVKDADGNRLGVKVTYKSENACNEDTDGTDRFYSFTSTILCDPENTAQGGAEWVSGSDNGCNVSITMKHAAGCHAYTAPWWIRFMHSVPWAKAIILIALGLVFALKGYTLLHTLAPLLLGVYVYALLIWGSAMLGLLDTTTLLVVVNVVAVILAIAVPWMVKQDWKVLTIVFTAAVSGVLGSYLFDAALTIWDIRSAWIYEACVIVFAVLGAVIGPKLTYGYLMATSFIGAYMIVRGLAAIFGGYPSEIQIDIMLRTEEPVNMKFFWYYMILLVTIGLLSARYQLKVEEEKAERGTDDEFEKV